MCFIIDPSLLELFFLFGSLFLFPPIIPFLSLSFSFSSKALTYLNYCETSSLHTLLQLIGFAGTTSCMGISFTPVATSSHPHHKKKKIKLKVQKCYSLCVILYKDVWLDTMFKKKKLHSNLRHVIVFLKNKSYKIISLQYITEKLKS